VATVLRDNARETDGVARLGGDEFGILMPGTDLEQARASLTRIAAAVGVACERPWAAGATFGAVTFAAPPADVDFAVGQADALMLRGKKHGRGCVLQAVWPPRPLADGFEERAQGATLGTDDEGG
jgi:diguanylate cyclase